MKLIFYNTGHLKRKLCMTGNKLYIQMNFILFCIFFINTDTVKISVITEYEFRHGSNVAQITIEHSTLSCMESRVPSFQCTCE